MSKNGPTQYTIRQIPKHVDHALRRESRRRQRSLNQVAIEAMSKGLGLADQPVRYHDLDALAGTWEEDKAFDKAVAVQDRIDPTLWK